MSGADKRYHIYRISSLMTIGLIALSLILCMSYWYTVEEDFSEPYETGRIEFQYLDNTVGYLHYQLQNPTQYDNTFVLWTDSDKTLEVDILRDGLAVDQNISVTNKGILVHISEGINFQVYHSLKFSYQSFQSTKPEYQGILEYLALYVDQNLILEFEIDYDHYYDSTIFENAAKNAAIGVLIVTFIVLWTYHGVVRTKNQRERVLNIKNQNPYEERRKGDLSYPTPADTKIPEYPKIDPKEIEITGTQLFFLLLFLLDLAFYPLFILLGYILFYSLARQFTRYAHYSNSSGIVGPFITITFPLLFFRNVKADENVPINRVYDVLSGLYVFLWALSIIFLFIYSRKNLGDRSEVLEKFNSDKQFSKTPSQFFLTLLLMTLSFFIIVYIRASVFADMTLY